MAQTVAVVEGGHVRRRVLLHHTGRVDRTDARQAQKAPAKRLEQALAKSRTLDPKASPSNGHCSRAMLPNRREACQKQT